MVEDMAAERQVAYVERALEAIRSVQEPWKALEEGSYGPRIRG